MKIQPKKIILYIFFVLVILTLSGCASQPETSSYGPGFFIGLWHGICAPFALIGSIFMDIRIYEFPNTGGWYDFGFILGIAFLGVGGGTAANS